jgi:hypothetical protein
MLRLLCELLLEMCRTLFTEDGTKRSPEGRRSPLPLASSISLLAEFDLERDLDIVTEASMVAVRES